MTKLSRRGFMGTAAAAGLGAAAGKTAPAQAGARSGRPLSTLLIVTDDHGDQLGCLGTPGLSTPHIDAIAGQGIIFPNAFSTCSSCSPSRSALLTGMYPHSNGHWRNTHTPVVPGQDADYQRDSRFADIEPVGVHEDIPTLVELLNAAGYVTGITQKFHLSPVWKYPFHHRLGATMRPESHAQAARTFFEAADGAPFFLKANIGNTHRPFRRPGNEKLGIPPVDPESAGLPAFLADTPAMRRDWADYLSTIQYADACVGAVMAELEAAGRLEDTLVIFTSDQGFAFHRAKATAYDDGIRVPLLVRAPGGARGLIRHELVSHVDLTPTILEAAGLPVPGAAQGRALQPLLAGSGEEAWRETVFAEHNSHGPNLPLEYFPVRSAFDGRFHYLVNLLPGKQAAKPLEAFRAGAHEGKPVAWTPQDCLPGGPWGNLSFEATLEAKEEFPLQYELLWQTFHRPPEELYDLHSDPDEMRNLAGDARFLTPLRRLREATQRWQEDTGDPGLALKHTPRRQGPQPA